VKSEREFYVVNAFLTNKVSCNDELFGIGDDGKDINTSRQFELEEDMLWPFLLQK
jgi:hypothetical protein